GEQRPDPVVHDLAPATKLIHHVGQNRRVEPLLDVVVVLRRSCVHHTSTGCLSFADRLIACSMRSAAIPSSIVTSGRLPSRAHATKWRTSPAKPCTWRGSTASPGSWSSGSHSSGPSRPFRYAVTVRHASTCTALPRPVTTTRSWRRSRQLSWSVPTAPPSKPSTQAQA